jgi:tRNA(Ile)-lysidine synthase
MEIVGAEAEFVSAAAMAWLRGRWPRFESLPVAVQRRCLQLELSAKGVVANFELVEQIREVANRPVTVSEKWSVSRDESGRVRVRPTRKSGFDPSELPVRMQGTTGEVRFGGVVIRWVVRRARGGTVRAPQRRVNSERFDADKVGRGIILRHWRPGDRFQPIGMGSAVKLQDLFTNRKIAREQRHGMVVATTAAGEVFWVESLRLAERFKLDSATKRQLQWRWKRV